ncbi:TetR/AcrR family transcriptional regulator [Verticiella sediminum]|uniref:TetR/AcrR family transcriptional regulator n=1 Tax=Verticiella sediminum TaxID=1247510 RepID=A0A556AB43_9BURK|nr:TetR/AcrR family transcriptional regulator [Verticiella sediminum]TSH90087.1 TetR/AcrR family transcriptional regulator [Verticiella sediminum]
MPRKKIDAGARAHSEQAGQLLDAAAAHVLAHGLGDLSLRHIAESVGTSHRMLIYYFGSSDGFWQALLQRLRHQEQAKSIGWSGSTHGPAHGIEAAWARYAAPNYLPVMQLLFEVYGRAIRDRERFKPFLDEVVGTWTDTLTQTLQSRFGIEPAQARVRARLELATMRGLLLDLVTTGDREGTTEALRYFARLMNADTPPQA